MDNYRGIDTDTGRSDADIYDEDDSDDAVMEPRHSFGTDERRMHVRAYNYWAAMLGERSLPAIEELDPESIEDFGPQSVLLDFTSGMENPAIHYLGDQLAEECGIDKEIHYISDVPPRSLLSRITDHYMQIIANQAPIGFEAEFVNQRGSTILYRGILLPFSSDDDTIDFIYGVINWKEMADQATTDALMLEVDQAIRTAPRQVEQVAGWADGPAAEDVAEEDGDEPQSDEGYDIPQGYDGSSHDSVIAPDFGQSEDNGSDDDDDGHLPQPDFGAQQEPIAQNADEDAIVSTDVTEVAATAKIDDADEMPNVVDEDADLTEWLADARRTAANASAAEERTRSALYKAVGRAYDFSVIAEREPDAFQKILDDSGLVVQDRAPMTPVVKLVFGADYDKTRLTEYAAALSHAHREQMPLGSFADYLENHNGGLKAVVQEERRLRRPQSAKESAADKLKNGYDALRAAEPVGLDAVQCGDSEFVVLVGRKLDNGTVGIVASVVNDQGLTDTVVKRATS